MYNVLDISRYVINYSNKQGYGISNLKLQKLLYFIQADFLISNEGKPCFDEEIEAWNFGPVVPESYHTFKHFGSSNIPEIKSYIKLDNDDIWSLQRVLFDDSIIAPKDKKEIESVVDMFSRYSATALVSLTHNQAPWKNAYIPGQNVIISKESIKEYFENE